MNFGWSTERKTPSSGSVLTPSNTPSTRVANRLADRTGKPIDELRPLADSIDPEALDEIFAGRSAVGASVTFRHEGFVVTVTGDGEVIVDTENQE